MTAIGQVSAAALAPPDHAPGDGAGIVRRLIDGVRAEVPDPACARYLEEHARLHWSPGRLDVTVRTTFLAETLARRIGDVLRRVAERELQVPAGDPLAVSFHADRSVFASAPNMPRPARRPAPTRERSRAARPDGASPEQARSWRRLEEFVVGRSNRLAFAAAEEIAGPALRPGAGRVFIHGGCGLGKTHLLQGIARRYFDANPAAIVRFGTAESFTNDFIASVRAGRVEAFRRSARRVDLLCLDDVQFLAGRRGTQDELLHMLDELARQGARVVLASDGHPDDIDRLGRALASRFVCGMVVRLEGMDRDLAQRLIEALARERGLTLEPRLAADAADALLSPGSTSRHPASARDLMGLIARLDALARLEPALAPAGRIGAILLRRALGSSASRPRRPIRIEHIAQGACEAVGVDVGEIYGKGRHQRVVLARSLAAYLSRQLTTQSYPEIARALGRPSHSSVLMAARRFGDGIRRGDCIATDPGAAPIRLSDLLESARQAALRASAG
jgi:chromosomal replication initiator protein